MCQLYKAFIYHSCITKSTNFTKSKYCSVLRYHKVLGTTKFFASMHVRAYGRFQVGCYNYTNSCADLTNQNPYLKILGVSLVKFAHDSLHSGQPT